MRKPPKRHVAGVPVDFPLTAYRAQNALMHAVVTSIRTSQHALIESPTGTGKSIALLCASLATQQYLINHQTASTLFEQIPAPITKPQPESTPDLKNISPQISTPLPTGSNAYDSDDDDFAPTKKFRDTSWQRPARKLPSTSQDHQPANAFMLNPISITQQDKPLDDFAHISYESSSENNPKIPRIFYATRTHNQVAQVIAELRKTTYRPKLSILASRREYCINDQVRDAPNRDETCKRLINKSSACPFFNQSDTLATSKYLKDEAWDIEELVQLGKQHSGCPYYASHHLYQNAQLILCPYSFLIDPICRSARGINVSGDVIILDEAHNIENFARESAGFDLDVAAMSRPIEEIESVLLLTRNPDLVVAYTNLKSLLHSFITLSENVASTGELRQRGVFEDAVFQQGTMLVKLNAVDINVTEVKKCRAAHDLILSFGDGNESKRAKRMRDSTNIVEMSPPSKPKANFKPHNRQSQISNVAKNVKEQLYGYGGQRQQPPDDETQSKDSPQEKSTKRRRRKPKSAEDIQPWLSRGMAMANEILTTLDYVFEHPDDFALIVDRRTTNFVTAVRIKMCCLNAAVCFREISAKARTVIVASGTLAPIKSFAGELGTTFSIAKSLPHVVNVQKQLFVGIVGNGPRRVPLNATYRGSSSFEFQDSLGDALVDYCKIVPGGVLVFFPSYRMMEQLQTRWRSSGVWERLGSIKGALLMEPNKRGELFDNLVRKYQQASSTEHGALLLGVCRGKLSEGIDFRDASSRAVIIVGIPFPHVADVEVNCKRSWNNRTRRDKNRPELQTGDQWYEMQGYRAMNQALGRALRHRYDYGAILLMDSRFRKRHVVNQMPGWTKEALKDTNDSYETILQNLQQFYKTVQAKISEISETDRTQPV